MQACLELATTARVLIADDDPDLLELLAIALRSRGYEVHSALDGAAAVEVHGRIHPDLLILDWMMPGLTGIEVCRQIREKSQDTTTPVLIYSAMGPGFEAEALEAGATEYHLKPMRVATFLARAAYHLESSR